MGSADSISGARGFVKFMVAAVRQAVRFAGKFARSLSDFGTPQFVAGLLWCLFCAWWNSLSQVFVDKIHWARFAEGNNSPLPDIGFILIPRIYISHLPDVWNAIIVVGTLVPVVMGHPQRVKIMRRFAAIQGTCFLLRSVTILVTILPNPYDTCPNSSSDHEIPFFEAFKVMLGMRITCGDVLYSGHAANFTLMALIWQEYGHSFVQVYRPNALIDQSTVIEDSDSVFPDAPQYSKEWYVSVFFPRLFWAVAFVGYLIIIACRFHYTVDVVVGIVVVAKQWGLYHMVIRTPKLLEKVPILQWYESKGVYAGSVKEDHVEEEEWDHFEETPAVSPQTYRPRISIGSPIAEVDEFALEEGTLK